jgi:hypothetical protein
VDGLETVGEGEGVGEGIETGSAGEDFATDVNEIVGPVEQNSLGESASLDESPQKVISRPQTLDFDCQIFTGITTSQSPRQDPGTESARLVPEDSVRTTIIETGIRIITPDLDSSDKTINPIDSTKMVPGSSVLVRQVSSSPPNGNQSGDSISIVENDGRDSVPFSFPMNRPRRLSQFQNVDHLP